MMLFIVNKGICDDGIQWRFVFFLLLSISNSNIFAFDLNFNEKVSEDLLEYKMESVFEKHGLDLSYFLDVFDQLRRNVEHQNSNMETIRKLVYKQSQEIHELKNAKIEMETTIRSQGEEIVKLKHKIFVKESSVKPNENDIFPYRNVSVNSEELYGHTLEKPKIPISKDQRKNDARNFLLIRQTENEKIAFTAYLDHEIKDIHPGMIVKCNQIILNQGNGYNKYTGIFTAPLRGTYFLTFTIHSAVEKLNVRLLKDGINVIGAVAHTDPSHAYRDTMASNSAVINAEAGSSFWLETAYDHNGELFSSEDYRYVTFTGFLLYY